MKQEETKSTFSKAKTLFSQLTGASYYGASFRSVLLNDREAMAAAEKLVERLIARKAEGISAS